MNNTFDTIVCLHSLNAVTFEANKMLDSVHFVLENKLKQCFNNGYANVLCSNAV